MKKRILTVILMAFLLVLCGCSSPQALIVPETPVPVISTTPTPQPTVVSTPQPTPTPAPDPDGVSVTAISEHTLKSPKNDSLDIIEQWPYLIASYKSSCTPLTLDEDFQCNLVLDTNIIERRIVYICPLHDGHEETTSYIDLFVDSNFDPTTKTLKIDGRSLTHDGMSLYSFLIRAVDESGNEVYYYTRVKT
ncbi:MAG: hypothetical protein IKK29_05480 [Christensenellaceae bacterium]|nr:hypothetical protein [Christensenellaceae bacterium]